MILKVLSSILFVLFLYFPVLGQEVAKEKLQPEERNDINVDGKVLYSENGDSEINFSLIHGLPSFTYQVNAISENADDFADLNYSAQKKNYADFTSEIEVNEYWKIIPEVEAGNSSFGMFDNQYYSDENRKFIRGKVRNEYKPAPARWNLDISSSRYEKNLSNKASGDRSSETFLCTGYMLSLEYIWSASNKVGVSLTGKYFDYEDDLDSDDDYFSSNEFYGTFRISEYLMITIAPRFLVNNDMTDYLYFRGGVSTVGIKNLSFELNYDYNNRHYDPVDFYETYKYIDMRYDVGPSTVHKTELKCNFQISSIGGAAAELENLGISLHTAYESNDNFHNYNLNSENLLYIEEIPLDFLNSGAGFVTKFNLFGHKFELNISYSHYLFFKRDEYENINITYRPEHELKTEAVYGNDFFEVSLENSYNSEVYQRIDNSEKLDACLIGTLSFYGKVSDSMHLYGKVLNLYDENIFYRYGYPEQGRHFLAGLRIVI